MLMLQILISLPDCCSSNITLPHSTHPTNSRTKYRFLCPIAPSSSSSSSSSYSESPTCSSLSRRKLITDTAAITLSVVLSSLLIGETHALPGDQGLSGWERVYLPIDIAFVPDDPTHGFLLGTKRTLLETKDGGAEWAPRSIASAEEEDFNYRFNSISFKGKEGWIIGKPAILLYTSDAGENWKRIPLSTQLPGDMLSN